jgi:superfamily II DNA/RNA helicase
LRYVKNKIETKELDLKHLKMFIIDEFDEVLKVKNNEEDLGAIINSYFKEQ